MRKISFEIPDIIQEEKRHEEMSEELVAKEVKDKIKNAEHKI